MVIYYINNESYIQKFVDICRAHDLPRNNRTIMVFKKGRMDGVNRDSIILPFKKKTCSEFKFKAPMLCSLSDDLSAFVLGMEKETLPFQRGINGTQGQFFTRDPINVSLDEKTAGIQFLKCETYNK